MGRYPREVRCAAVKCISCNAPVAPTVAGSYVCVECGAAPLQCDGELDLIVREENPPADSSPSSGDAEMAQEMAEKPAK